MNRTAPAMSVSLKPNAFLGLDYAREGIADKIALRISWTDTFGPHDLWLEGKRAEQIERELSRAIGSTRNSILARVIAEESY